MGRLLSTLFAAGLLWAAPQAGAAPVALLDAPRAQDVAVSGDEVLVGRAARGGGVLVDAVARTGGVARRLLSVPAPRRGWAGSVRVAASPGVVAVLVSFERGADPAEYHVYSGPPAGPLELHTRTPWSSRDWLPFDLDADGDRVLVSEGRLRDLSFRARVLAPGGVAEPVPWPGILLPPAVLSGDRVAFVGSSRGGRDARVAEAFVVDRRSGSNLASIALRPSEDVEEDDLDLAPDGRLIAAADGRLLTVAPGVPPARLPGRGFTRPRFAGSDIAAAQAGRFDARRPVLLPSETAAPRAVGSPSASLDALEADEAGVAWLANGCVLHAPGESLPPAEPPTGPCPRAEVVHEEGDQVLRGRRLGVVITCVAAPASGCRGSALLGRRGQMGRGEFQLRAGTRRTVDVTLTNRGMRRVRRGVRRDGAAFFTLGSRVLDGRSHGTQAVLVDRVRRRSARGRFRGSADQHRQPAATVAMSGARKAAGVVPCHGDGPPRPSVQQVDVESAGFLSFLRRGDRAEEHGLVQLDALPHLVVAG